MVTVGDMNELMSAFGMKADSITVSDRVVGNSLLIAGRIQNGLFPEVVLERIASFGGILSCLEKRNIELDIEEVGKRKINLYYGG